ncbi:MAG: hypothetical protein Q9227_006558 [Pyrenula ochraceoflavens]
MRRWLLEDEDAGLLQETRNLPAKYAGQYEEALRHMGQMTTTPERYAGTSIDLDEGHEEESYNFREHYVNGCSDEEWSYTDEKWTRNSRSLRKKKRLLEGLGNIISGSRVGTERRATV